MSEPARVKHAFVEFIPPELEPDTIYISGAYATCSHLCLCGCGQKVVTPLAPDEWHLSFDGETVSFNHSFGNWSFDCQSHYWIENSRVVWAGAWSKEKVAANRARDRRRKQALYGEPGDKPSAVESAVERPGHRPGWLWRVLRRLRLTDRR